jgi:hypothetical protein
MKTTIIVVFLAAAIAAISPSRMSGQTPSVSPFNPKSGCAKGFEQYRAEYKTATDDAARKTASDKLARLFNPHEQAGCVTYLILDAYPDQTRASLFLGFVSAAEKQAGSSSTSGSTSLVSKNFTSRLLSVANEYGALTSSTSGQTTTISGSLDQLFAAIGGVSKGVFTECAVKTIPGVWCVRSGLMNFLGRVSYSTSLDLNQPSTITGTATGTAAGTAQQVTGTQGGNSFALSQFTAKFFIWAHKPAKTDLLKAWTDSKDAPSDDAWQKLKNIQDANDKGAAWKKWLGDALPTLLTSSNPKEIQAQIQGLMSTLIAGGTSKKNLVQAALDYSASLASTAQAERAVYDNAAWAKPILTFEYDYNTPSNQPTNSTYRLVFGKSLTNCKAQNLPSASQSNCPPSWKMTANAAGSFYNSTPSTSIPGSRLLRDLQVGIEADRDPQKLGSSSLTAAFTAAYYFQDQTSPAILNVTPSSPISGVSFTGLSSNATQVFTQKGKIHFGQLKITLGNSTSGWRFPIAITGSNRSELITKSTIGAQVGISYDFDSLFSGANK